MRSGSVAGSASPRDRHRRSSIHPRGLALCGLATVLAIPTLWFSTRTEGDVDVAAGTEVVRADMTPAVTSSAAAQDLLIDVLPQTSGLFDAGADVETALAEQRSTVATEPATGRLDRAVARGERTTATSESTTTSVLHLGQAVRDTVVRHIDTSSAADSRSATDSLLASTDRDSQITVASPNDSASTTQQRQRPTTSTSTTAAPRTPSTAAPSTRPPTTQPPTTQAPVTQAPTTAAPTTAPPTTAAPTTQPPTTAEPITGDPTSSQWAALRQCEAHGSYTVVSANGLYHGAYQFSASTWDSTARQAGRSDLVGVAPSAASPADQDALALALWRSSGWAPWPHCGSIAASS